MSVPPIIPPEWSWAYDIAVGQNWPQADEDAVRRVAQAWTDALQGLVAIADGGNTAATNVNYSVQSISSDEFNNYWSKYVNGDNSVVGQMAQQAEILAQELLSFAEQTEFTKLSINIQLVILFIQLAIDLVTAVVTAGASLSEGVVAAFITRISVENILKELIKAVVMAVLPDVITQAVMLADGHRSSFDVGETLQAAQMGLIGAGVGMLTGGVLNKLGVTGALDGTMGKLVGGGINAAITGAITNVGTNAATGLADNLENQIHASLDPKYAAQLATQQQDQGIADQKANENPLVAALNGAFTGALFHGVHEGSVAWADNVYHPTEFTTTTDAGQTVTYKAIQKADGTYAVHTENYNYVGTGTVDGTSLTVNPLSGNSFTATQAPAHTGTADTAQLADVTSTNAALDPTGTVDPTSTANAPATTLSTDSTSVTTTNTSTDSAPLTTFDSQPLVNDQPVVQPSTDNGSGVTEPAVDASVNEPLVAKADVTTSSATPLDGVTTTDVTASEQTPAPVSTTESEPIVSPAVTEQTPAISTPTFESTVQEPAVTHDPVVSLAEVSGTAELTSPQADLSAVQSSPMTAELTASEDQQTAEPVPAAPIATETQNPASVGGSDGSKGGSNGGSGNETPAASSGGDPNKWLKARRVTAKLEDPLIDPAAPDLAAVSNDPVLKDLLDQYRSTTDPQARHALDQLIGEHLGVTPNHPEPSRQEVQSGLRGLESWLAAHEQGFDGAKDKANGLLDQLVTQLATDEAKKDKIVAVVYADIPGFKEAYRARYEKQADWLASHANGEGFGHDVLDKDSGEFGFWAEAGNPPPEKSTQAIGEIPGDYPGNPQRVPWAVASDGRGGLNTQYDPAWGDLLPNNRIKAAREVGMIDHGIVDSYQEALRSDLADALKRELGIAGTGQNQLFDSAIDELAGYESRTTGHYEPGQINRTLPNKLPIDDPARRQQLADGLGLTDAAWRRVAARLNNLRAVSEENRMRVAETVLREALPVRVSSLSPTRLDGLLRDLGEALRQGQATGNPEHQGYQDAVAKTADVLAKSLNLDPAPARELAGAMQSQVDHDIGHGQNRINDAEAKLMAQTLQVLRGMGEPAQVAGTLVVASNKEMCLSCQDLVARVQSEYPNVRILIGGKGTEDPARLADTPGFSEDPPQPRTIGARDPIDQPSEAGEEFPPYDQGYPSQGSIISRLNPEAEVRPVVPAPLDRSSTEPQATGGDQATAASGNGQVQIQEQHHSAEETANLSGAGSGGLDALADQIGSVTAPLDQPPVDEASFAAEQVNSAITFGKAVDAERSGLLNSEAESLKTALDADKTPDERRLAALAALQARENRLALEQAIDAARTAPESRIAQSARDAATRAGLDPIDVEAVVNAVKVREQLVAVGKLGEDARLHDQWTRAKDELTAHQKQRSLRGELLRRAAGGDAAAARLSERLTSITDTSRRQLDEVGQRAATLRRTFLDQAMRRVGEALGFTDAETLALSDRVKAAEELALEHRAALRETAARLLEDPASYVEEAGKALNDPAPRLFRTEPKPGDPPRLPGSGRTAEEIRQQFAEAEPLTRHLFEPTRREPEGTIGQRLDLVQAYAREQERLAVTDKTSLKMVFDVPKLATSLAGAVRSLMGLDQHHITVGGTRRVEIVDKRTGEGMRFTLKETKIASGFGPTPLEGLIGVDSPFGDPTGPSALGEQKALSLEFGNGASATVYWRLIDGEKISPLPSVDGPSVTHSELTVEVRNVDGSYTKQETLAWDTSSDGSEAALMSVAQQQSARLRLAVKIPTKIGELDIKVAGEVSGSETRVLQERLSRATSLDDIGQAFDASQKTKATLSAKVALVVPGTQIGPAVSVSFEGDPAPLFNRINTIADNLLTLGRGETTGLAPIDPERVVDSFLSAATGEPAAPPAGGAASLSAPIASARPKADDATLSAAEPTEPFVRKNIVQALNGDPAASAPIAEDPAAAAPTRGDAHGVDQGVTNASSHGAPAASEAAATPVSHATITNVTRGDDHILLELNDGRRTTQARLDATSSGIVVSSLDENGKILRSMAGTVGSEEGVFNVFAHSDAHGIVVDGMHLPFSELADRVADVPKDVPIRLYGCDAGADGAAAAAELALVSGHDVIAADAPVWLDRHGNVIAASQVDTRTGPRPNLVDDGSGALTGDGTWKIVHPTPDGKIEVTDLNPSDPLHPAPAGHVSIAPGDFIRLGLPDPPAHAKLSSNSPLYAIDENGDPIDWRGRLQTQIANYRSGFQGGRLLLDNGWIIDDQDHRREVRWQISWVPKVSGDHVELADFCVFPLELQHLDGADNPPEWVELGLDEVDHGNLTESDQRVLLHAVRNELRSAGYTSAEITGVRTKSNEKTSRLADTRGMDQGGRPFRRRLL